MKTWKIITVATLAIVAVALITASALAYNSKFTYPFRNQRNGMMGGTSPSGYPSHYGGWGGMMSGRFCSSAPNYPNNATKANLISMEQAVTIAKDYLTSLNNPDLAVSQVEEYTNNFYVSYYEKSTGIGAFQMLIDRYTGNIYPEMGPNVTWNIKYGIMNGYIGGMMGGMMSNWRTTPTTPMTVNIEQAKANAQEYLNTYYPGTTVGDVETFYGYYNIEVLQSSTICGMLSVNGFTGQVWYHNWHGTFIQEWQP